MMDAMEALQSAKMLMMQESEQMEAKLHDERMEIIRVLNDTSNPEDGYDELSDSDLDLLRNCAEFVVTNFAAKGIR